MSSNRPSVLQSISPSAKLAFFGQQGISIILSNCLLGVFSLEFFFLFFVTDKRIKSRALHSNFFFLSSGVTTISKEDTKDEQFSAEGGFPLREYLPPILFISFAPVLY